MRARVMGVAGTCVLAIALLSAGGCDSIVGAECAEGFVPCAGRCVVTCEPDDAGGSLDASSLDAGPPLADGSADDGAVPDGGQVDGGDDASVLVDGGGTDAAAPDGGPEGDAGAPADGSAPTSCGLGELACAGSCVDGLADPAHCGACDVACGSGEVCAAGACRPSCDAPLVLCGGRCVDLTSDPDHCGACDVACTDTGLCIDGECSSALAGHVVVLGHDYEASRTAQDRLAGNALFLARGSPVRAIVWEGTVSDASRLGAEAAIDRTAVAIGRSWSAVRVADASEVPLRLAGADALLVHAQARGTDAELAALGASWAGALREFLARGGVIVVFETLSVEHRGTWQILQAAGLFDAVSRDDATGAIVDVVAPADAVAVRVPLSYVGQRTTVHFDTATDVVVARDAAGAVVVHRTVVP